MPIIFSAAACASPGFLTTLTPPPLPRPPAAEALADAGRLGRVEDDLALRHRYAVARQEGFRLILVNLHV
jgi:hypothetical protein